MSRDDKYQVRDDDSVQALADLQKVLGKHLNRNGPELFKQALIGIGFLAVTLPGTKTLGPGDQTSFGPPKAWKGPSVENGCLVYEVVGDDGKVYVKHPNGKTQTHPPGNKDFFKKGDKVYICGGTLAYPGAGSD